MKALVLCAGRGTRLRPLTHTRAKAALPVAGRPVLAHIFDYLQRFGFTEIGVVISPDQDELRVLPGAPGQQVTFIVQPEPLGIAHAVQTAAAFLGGEPFLLYLGDNLTGEDLQPALHRFASTKADGVIAVREVLNPEAFGIAVLQGDRVTAVEEKPKVPASNLAIAGIYLFRPAIHQAIQGLKPSARGELEITDAIARLVSAGKTITAHRMTGWWQDMGTPEGLLAANAFLLDTIGTDIAPDVFQDHVRTNGPVVIGPGARLVRVTLRGPVFIGAGATVEDAWLGPYTSVGEGAVIAGATVKNSILLPGCRLEVPGIRLEDCLLGQGAVVEAAGGPTVTLLVGDEAHLRLPGDRR